MASFVQCIEWKRCIGSHLSISTAAVAAEAATTAAAVAVVVASTSNIKCS